MTIAWEGWKLDRNLRRMISPRAAILPASVASLFEALILAQGAPVARRELARSIAAGSRSRDPVNMVGMAVHKFNTLARDLGILVTDHGFSLRAAGIVDMFPHTSHVESVAVLDGPGVSGR